MVSSAAGESARRGESGIPQPLEPPGLVGHRAAEDSGIYGVFLFPNKSSSAKVLAAPFALPP